MTAAARRIPDSNSTSSSRCWRPWRSRISIPIRHCANSGALARYPEMYLDMVRPGIALYGVGEDAKALGLQPVMSLKSCISTIKVFDPDTDISYGRTFHTRRKTRVGVLPIGYADGLFRGLSNRMAVQTAQGPAKSSWAASAWT